MASYPNKAGTIITFYSYKGGTGRSMALVNAACLLAREKIGTRQRVLVVDWDLEAPGLYKFFSAKTATLDQSTQPGIINYFKTLQELLRENSNLHDQISAAQGWKVLSKVLPIDEYIISDAEPGVDLIPAGRFDSGYAMLVGSFNWAEFYAKFSWAIKAFRELLTSKYEHCLIDSRTGLTDISGICTMLLPEKLVTVFTPNNQSLLGVIDLVRVAVNYRRESDDLRPLAVFPLPSRIDLAEKELREKWRLSYQRAFEDCFRQAYDIEECDLTAYFDEVQLPHVSYYAYGENISVLREARTEAFTLSRAYQVFMQRLIHLTYSWERRSVAYADLRQLRAPVGDFVGREQQIRTLINTLRQRGDRASIIGISGMGGIGKTELALLVADRLADDYPDGQVFINLQGTDAHPLPPEEVLATCIRALLGPEARLPQDLHQLSQLYRSQLSGKRMLLLLDNAADSAQVRPLLPPAGSALLVTSRQTITLPGMTPLTLSVLTDKEARELLLDIAPRAEPVAEQICALCGYLPLAIRAAGSLLAITTDLDPVDYVKQLEDQRRRLERIGAEGVELGLEASFNLSYAGLAPEAARVFCLLSVFPGYFDSAAEEIICGDADHAQLTDLVRHSLVLYESSTKRYRLHDLARLFADSRLSEDERSTTQKRHATHYKDVLTATNSLYRHGGEALTHSLALFDLEWNNIQAGHSWVAAHAGGIDEDVDQLAMTYPQAGLYVLKLRQHSREQIRWLEIAVAAARRLKNRVGEGLALGSLGLAYWRLGEPRRAIEFHEQYLTLVREIGNRLEEGNALGNLGLAYTELGEHQRAIQFFEQQLRIVREIGNRRGEGTALGNLGLAYWNLSEIQRAVAFWEQHLTIAREIGDRRDEGIALGNLGLAYRDLGQIERAIEFNNQRLTIAREIGDRKGEGTALGNLGLAYTEQGETRRSIQFYEQQLRIVREIGDRRGEATALWSMAGALHQLGEMAQAIEYGKQSLTIREQIEDPRAATVRTDLAAWQQAIN